MGQMLHRCTYSGTVIIMKSYVAVAPGSVTTFENSVPFFVPDDLHALHGPTSGTVSLPLHLDWSESSSYDLSRQSRLRSLYSTVIREAGSEQELANWLNYDLLIREWCDLNIPAAVRQAWESVHPELQCP